MATHPAIAVNEPIPASTRRAQREHHRDRVISALLRAPIADRGKMLQQVTTLQRDT